ncbi:hypothetical protein KJ575_05350 [Patescibacteria group bacterium]|nr:hypothetical protein [Patescibacteria group bacterium]MBU4142286.1 hypothetical protein [Patescibacteria group bacterium]MBU4369104.1 hypothetical protein [Patescibacteria group bacterium]
MTEEVLVGIREEVPGTGYIIHGILKSDTESRVDLSLVSGAKKGRKIIPGQTIKLGKKKVTLVRIAMEIQKAYFKIN